MENFTRSKEGEFTGEMILSNSCIYWISSPVTEVKLITSDPIGWKYCKGKLPHYNINFSLIISIWLKMILCRAFLNSTTKCVTESNSFIMGRF